MQLRGSLGTYVLAPQPMKAGGEGEIYEVQGHSDLVVKLYKPNILSRELEEKLTYMRNNPPSQSIMNQIAWPIDILRDAYGKFVGFTMPKLSIDADLKSVYVYPEKPDLPISYEHRVILALNICIVIAEVHKAGYVFGDFNPLNIGVNLTTGHVAFMDTDSYHITDRSSGKVYRCGVCLDGYVAPELILQCKGTDFSNAPLPTFTQETDRFALAIHIYKLLMNGYTPFNGIKEGASASTASPGVGNFAIERDNYCFKPGNKPQSVATPDMSSLSPDIQYLFKKTFINGVNNPSQRATAEEWLDALKEYKNELVQCKQNPRHFYYRSNAQCPYCAADARYHQSLAGATSTPRPNPVSQPVQLNFTNPVNQTNTSNGGYGTTRVQPQPQQQQQPQSKPFNWKRLLLWIFFFPFMAVAKIFKSNMGLLGKLFLSYIVIAVFFSFAGTAYNVWYSNYQQKRAEDGIKSDANTDGNFQFVSKDNGYEVAVIGKKKDKLEDVVQIPSEYKGEKVVAIAENGFADCTNVKAFIVPDTVTTIGAGAFEGCDNLTSITLPFIGNTEDAVEEKAVLGYIFGFEMINTGMDLDYNNGFYNVKPVDIPGETWQYSYRHQFSRDEYYYYIPDSLAEVIITRQTNIPIAAFNGCKNLVTIRYESAPEDKITVGDAAFQNCVKLQFGDDGKTLELGNKVTEIGAYAYANCKNITNVTVSDMVRNIGVGAFKGCDNLESLTLPFIGNSETAENEAAVLGYIFGYEMINTGMDLDYNNGFYNVKPMDIPGETWQYTYRHQFSRDEYYYYIPDSLTEVTITKQTAIPTAAFNGCTNLTTIRYEETPEERITVGDAAFQNCINLRFGEDGSTLELGMDVEGIGAYAYANCKNLTTVKISNMVRNIGVGAFKGCDNLESLTLPFVGASETATEKEAVLGFVFGYDRINTGKDLDYNTGFYNVKPVDMPGQTWQYSYRHQFSLDDFYYNVPDSLDEVIITKQTEIPTAAFNGCENLSKVVIPKGSTKGEAAFQGCDAEVVEE